MGRNGCPGGLKCGRILAPVEFPVGPLAEPE
jgi:hypothetical protein